jgi:CRP-like cAMP-binding protein
MAASTHEQKRDLFQSHFLLGKLEPGEIDTLATRGRVESYRAGQEIFAKGSPGDTMIVVLQGSVKILSLSPTGKEVVVHAGAVLGELAVITGEGRSASAAAMTDCELLIIDRRDVLPMFERHFEICIMLMQILCRRLRETGEQVEDVLFRSRGLEARVAEQVEELGRIGRLKRFLPPQLAELIVSQGDEKSSKAIAARSSSCSAICAATPPLLKQPSPRTSSNFCANTTARWGRSSPSSKAPSTISRAMASWCSSTIRCHVPTLPSVRSRWRWRCARRRVS